MGIVTIIIKYYRYKLWDFCIIERIWGASNRTCPNGTGGDFTSLRKVSRLCGCVCISLICFYSKSQVTFIIPRSLETLSSIGNTMYCFDFYILKAQDTDRLQGPITTRSAKSPDFVDVSAYLWYAYSKGQDTFYRSRKVGRLFGSISYNICLKCIFQKRMIRIAIKA